jgi:hypothetical protein
MRLVDEVSPYETEMWSDGYVGEAVLQDKEEPEFVEVIEDDEDDDWDDYFDPWLDDDYYDDDDEYDDGPDSGAEPEGV